jgi:putative membrane protein
MSDRFIEPLLIFIRGLFMGSVEAVPGFSAGTVALITGIYERLIHSIGKIKFSFAKPLLKGNFSEFKKNLLTEIDFQFFIPLLLGMVIAVLTISKVIEFLINDYPAFSFAFFFGLILASSYMLYKKVVHFSFKMIILSVIGFILSFIFVGLNPIAANHSIPIILFSGLIASCAMLLPGISGAFILVLLGQYRYMLNALNTLSWAEIITFCAGALIGILSFSKFLDYLLRNHEAVTLAFLVGVMIGTLRVPFDEVVTNLANLGNPQFDIIFSVVLAIVGFISVVLLEMKFKYIE